MRVVSWIALCLLLLFVATKLVFGLIPGLSLPLTVQDALSQACAQEEASFGPNDFMSFWSRLSVVFMSELFMEFLGVARLWRFQYRYKSKRSGSAEDIKNMLASQKKFSLQLSSLFVFVNCATYFYGLVELCEKVASLSDKTFLCRATLVSSSVLYKGMFGSFWRLCLGVTTILWSQDEQHSSVWTWQTFLILVVAAGPVLIAILSLVLIVPLVVVFLPMVLLFALFCNLLVPVAVQTLIEQMTKEQDNLVYCLRDKAKTLQDTVTPMFLPDEQNNRVGRFGRRMFIWTYLELVLILLLFAPFYRG